MTEHEILRRTMKGNGEDLLVRCIECSNVQNLQLRPPKSVSVKTTLSDRMDSRLALVEADEDELISRLLERGKVTNRSDDQDIDKIKNRFNEYNNKTSILINYYKNQSKFFSVDGKGSVDDITSRLFDLVDSLK